MLVFGLLAGAAVVAALAQRLGMPYLVALVVVGIVEAKALPTPFHVRLDPFVLGLFLPALIFEAAWDVDLAALRRQWGAIAILAVPGVLVTATAVAVATWLGAGVPLGAALVLGALVGATDPVAVLGLFRRLGIPHELLTIVEGESIANDGVAAALVQGLVVFALAGSGAGGVLGIAGQVVASMAIGIAFGLLGALVVAPLLLRFPRRRLATIAATIFVAYGTSVAATALGGSGILASATAGLALRAMLSRGAFAEDDSAVERVWDVLAFVANAIVFYLVGLSLDLERVVEAPLVILLALAATFGSRLILAYVLVPIGRHGEAGLRWRHAIALAGLRGGLSLALALGTPHVLPGREAILGATVAIVFATLVVQGVLLGPLLRRLGFGV